MAMDRALRLLRKKPGSFEVQVQDMILRITAPAEYYEESRAAALSFWDQLHAYSLRDADFARSERPVRVPDDSPDLIQEMAEVARAAGVGPMFTFRGAVTDRVGQFLARSMSDLTVACEGNYFVASRKRVKLTVAQWDEGAAMSIVLDPARGPQGLYSSIGQEVVPGADGLVVLATSCKLADATAAGAASVLASGMSLRHALAHIQRVDGALGGLVMRGEEIGVAGAIEIAS